MHSCYLCESLLRSYPDDNIHRYFCLQRCVRYSTLSSERWGCTLLRDVKLASNKYSEFSGFYVDFTIHYLLAI